MATEILIEQYYIIRVKKSGLRISKQISIFFLSQMNVNLGDFLICVKMQLIYNALMATKSSLKQNVLTKTISILKLLFQK